MGIIKELTATLEGDRVAVIELRGATTSYRDPEARSEYWRMRQRLIEAGRRLGEPVRIELVDDEYGRALVAMPRAEVE